MNILRDDYRPVRLTLVLPGRTIIDHEEVRADASGAELRWFAQAWAEPLRRFYGQVGVARAVWVRLEKERKAA